MRVVFTVWERLLAFAVPNSCSLMAIFLVARRRLAEDRPLGVGR